MKSTATNEDTRPKPNKAEPLIVELIDAGDTSRAYITSIEVKGKLVMASGGSYYTPVVIASTDGKTFRRRTIPGAAAGLRGIRVLDDEGKSVWVVGEFGVIARTTDRGATWTVSKNSRQPCLWDLIEEKETGALWIAGDEGLVLKSKNGGTSWERVKVPFEPRDSRPDPTIERVAAGIFFTLFACVWDPVAKKFFKPKGLDKAKLSAIAIARDDPSTVLAVGDRGSAYRSTNGGHSFTKVHTGVTAHLEDVAFVGGTFVAVGDAGTILRVTPDGKKVTKLAARGPLPVREPVSKTKKHLWSIGSWGSGAIIGGDGKLLMRVATKDDRYWDGAEDELAIRIAPVPGFAPAKRPTKEEIEKRHQTSMKSAIAEYEKLPKPKRRERGPADERSFDETIMNDPDDAANFMVYTDLLQSRGDPRGELAALTQEEVALAPNGAAPRLGKGAAAIVKRHATTLLGKLREVPSGDVAIDLAWRHGFIHSAYVRAIGVDPEEKPTRAAEFVGHLLAEPSARYLRELRVGVLDYWRDVQEPIVKLIASVSLPTLRSLCLGEPFGDSDQEAGDDESAYEWGPLGDPSKMCASLPRLEELRLFGGSIKLGRLVLPRLRILTLGARSVLDRASLRSLAASSLPSLEKLTLVFDTSSSDTREVTVKVLERFLKDAADAFPRLSSVGLVNFQGTNDLIAPLARSKLIAQLRDLDLSHGTLSDEGAAQLLGYAPAFARLDSIRVCVSYLSKELIAKLEALGPAIDARDQREDPGEDERRVPSIVE